MQLLRQQPSLCEIVCNGFSPCQRQALPFLKVELMGKTSESKDLQSILNALKSTSFAVTGAPSAYASGSYLISKYGAAAIVDGKGQVIAGPGALVHGQIAHLLDRGYQKFLQTREFELPATATQLASIHRFNDEFHQLLGGKLLFNQALGSTSDLYHYDRIKGREADEHRGSTPWQSAGH